MSDKTRRVLFCIGMIFLGVGLSAIDGKGSGVPFAAIGALLLGITIPLPSKAK